LDEDPAWLESTSAAYLSLQVGDDALAFTPADLHTVRTLFGYIDKRDRLIAGLSDDATVARTQLLAVKSLQAMVTTLQTSLLLLPKGRQAGGAPPAGPHPRIGARRAC
jgi:hypothetical protein